MLVLLSSFLVLTSSVLAVLPGPGDPDISNWKNFLPSYLHEGIEQFIWAHRDEHGVFFAPNIRGEFAYFYTNKGFWPVEAYSHRTSTSDYGCKVLYKDATAVVDKKTINLKDVIESYVAAIAPKVNVKTPTGVLQAFAFKCRLSYLKTYSAIHPGKAAPAQTALFGSSKKFKALDKDVNDHELMRARKFGPWQATCPKVGQIIEIRLGKAYCLDLPGHDTQPDTISASGSGQSSQIAEVSGQASRDVVAPAQMLTVFLSPALFGNAMGSSLLP